MKTEFKFTLPKGFVDKDGNLHREGTMRLANAKDEIDPLSDHRVKHNRAYLVVILLSRVITKLGTLREVTPNIVEQFFSSDLAYLQSFYRQINEDGSTAIPVSCPHCKSDFEVDIGSLGGGSGLGES